MSEQKTILLAGDPRLEQVAAAVDWPDLGLAAELETLHRALSCFRAEHAYGRAIAAPQLGIGKRLVAMQTAAAPPALVNPEITWRSAETFELWDDCLSVPDVVVRVRRHCSISLRYRDAEGRRHEWRQLEPALSELVQHEVDHLDGVLMTARALPGDSVRPIAERAALIDPQRAGRAGFRSGGVP